MTVREENQILSIGSQIEELFSRKIIYSLEHNAQGMPHSLEKCSLLTQRRMTCDNMHLIGTMKFTERNGFPILSPFCIEKMDFTLYSYKERRKHKDETWAIHFFMPDYLFLHAITKKLMHTTQEVAKCDIVFAPDCSLYVDAPTFFNKTNIFRSRFAAAYWQSCGLNVIQTASWGDANSLNYCFEGLAEHSTTAVCGIGHNFCRQAKRLWQYAVKRLVDEKAPTSLIVYGGKEDDIPQLDTQVFFVNDYINSHFRK